ncbi:pilus assembly protein PilY [Paucibacter sp. KBW04]|uniref:pilus assembly protein n=1 Tax=Paucibacter sp. KBW04 TaxID=2153361 RepID=UPI000F56C643|nr:PilC/PilY family type IV pilus protein [Paucibacter sp. KBW04]RQO62626.1 pilus assembly protein PilY [Paucibacter sp. KBW04]
MNLFKIPHALACSLLLLALSWQNCFAGTADISDKPLGTMSNGTLVRSNLMFVLDNSGSMSWNFLPDDAQRNNVCFGAVSDNLVFYDPTRTYDPPLKSDGTLMANASFTSAWNDGYNTSSGSNTNLSNNNPETPDVLGPIIDTNTSSSTASPCGKSTSSSCALPRPNPRTSSYWDGTNTITTTVLVERVNAPGKTCNSSTSNSCALKTTTTQVTNAGQAGPFLWATRKASAPAGSCLDNDFDIVRASSSLTAAQKTNYANWYSYYRTRMLAIRAGAGRAFALIDATRFRVGFSRISDYANGGSDSTGFLNIRDYDSGTQKVDFFTRLYGTSGTSNTPLRPALARAGRYFANRLSGQSDPMQYSCQRNYTILSTDGYWNQDSAAPLNVSGGSGVGNLDGDSSVDRPMRDQLSIGETLADVAMYYYMTDLRTPALGNCNGAVSGQTVCDNNVPSDGKKDTNSAQHMTTFTMGLGLNGTLRYDKNYETQSSGDFFDLKQGNKNWPDPINNVNEERIDDLWHAAVNGRGVYYSAKNSADMAASLVDALTKIDATTGSSAAAATSSLTPSAGDDWLFIPVYTTKTWDGTVNAHKINTASGEVINPSTPVWSAASRIKGQGTRSILFRGGSAASGLAEFTEPNLRSAGFASAFDSLCASGSFRLSQCASLSSAAQAKVTATNVVDFLRGNSSYEQSAAALDDQLFRIRSSPMGDIVNGAPVYVKKPPLSYADGYATYAHDQMNRQGVLYVAANDGMLHALKVSEDSTGGTELWAYVPSMVISDMYVLADARYETLHRFYVDGAPVVSDVYDGSKWRTILIGGLGKGGRGYYALDVTDPNAPVSLWEYTDTDLGYTFGNPIITKNKAGTWVVAFSSGYNNVSPGDGKGYLYVLDAVAGTLISKVGTGAGDTGTPSNLGKINAWVDDDKLNIASRIYGGDMLGNVWRFDFDDNYAPTGREAVLVGKTGSNQPITTKPVLSEIVSGQYKYPVISVATGRYLGTTDVGDTATQSIYTFKDQLATTGLGALRSNAGMVKQTLKADRSGLLNPSTVNWATQLGWYVDLNLTTGERVNVDFDQQLNQLIVASNIPTPTVCSPGGTSWLYYLDVGSGTPLLAYSGTTLVAGITSIVGSTGKLITLIQGVDGKNVARNGAEVTPPTMGSMRRTSWRELMN